METCWLHIRWIDTRAGGKVASDLWLVGSFRRVLRFPPPGQSQLNRNMAEKVTKKEIPNSKFVLVACVAEICLAQGRGTPQSGPGRRHVRPGTCEEPSTQFIQRHFISISRRSYSPLLLLLHSSTGNTSSTVGRASIRRLHGPLQNGTLHPYGVR